VKVIRILGIGDTTYYDPSLYLERYEPDRHISHEDIELTTDINRAQRFADSHAALTWWKTACRVPRYLYRMDGRLNRPLSAFTISIEDAEQKEG
jgi:hypothetical protein